MSIFSERLIELMNEQDVKPETLAHNIGVDLSMIYKYIRQEFLPSAENLIKIVNYFKCNVDYLLGNSDILEKFNHTYTSNFKLRFRELLEKENISRYAFNKQTGFSRQSIDDWYNGVRLPTTQNLILIAKYFNCSIDYLLGRE